MRLGDRQLVAPGLLERRSADVLHHDVADRVAVLVGMLDEVVDLDDPRVRHLGEELPLGHRDLLRLGVAGMHQTLEHDGPFVDVVVEGQIHPAQPAVRDAALDLVLVGDHVAGTQLRQERIRAAAVRAPALRQRPAVGRRPADRACRSSSRTVSTRPQRDWSSARTADRSRAPAGSPPDRRRAGGSATAPASSSVAWSSGSVSAVPTEMPSESSKCGRNTACVAIGRIVDMESMSSSSRLAGLGCRVRRGLRILLPSDISPSTSGPGVRAAGRAPSTICGTTCSTCRHGGCGPACR